MRPQQGNPRRLKIVALAAVAALVSSQPAHALTFNLIPANGTPQQAIDAFQMAANRWSALFSDPVTVNINIGYTALGPGILGQTSTSSSWYSYTQTRTALSNDRVTPDDFSTVAHLPAGANFKMLLNYTSNNPNGAGSATPYLDNDNDPNNNTIYMSFANQKAMGLLAGNNSASDASITFSSSFTFDFDPRDGITPGAYDFVGVATHEMGHALGFTSGVDILDNNSTSPNFYPDDQFIYVKPLDLFRFSTDGVNAGGNGTIDWTADNRVKYFSIDGGTTAGAIFANGTQHGDGRQASHWKDTPGPYPPFPIGIMDPTAGLGELMAITANDRQALDVIGWNPANSWSWINPNGGSFASAPQWSSDVVPQSPQDAIFNLNNTYAVTFGGSVTNANTLIRQGNVTLNLAGFTYAQASGLVVAPIGGDSALLNVTGGTVAPSSGAIGGTSAAAGGTGGLALNPGGALNVTGNLTIWSGGTLIFNGGSASAGNILLKSGAIQAATSGSIASPLSTTGGTLQTDAGTLTITGALTTAASTTLTKTGPGTLTIAGAQNHGVGAAMNIVAGIANFNSNATGLNITDNATVNFNATQNLAALTIGPSAGATLSAGGMKTLQTASLNIDPAGRLDMTDREVIVDYTGATVAPTIRNYLITGRNTGSWDGPGIGSSAAVPNYNALGYAEAADLLPATATQTVLWHGQTVDDTAILIKYTYAGDATLDGQINIDDYVRIDDGISQQLPGWFNGDFNYDGKVDIDDYMVIDGVIGSQGPNIDPTPGIGEGEGISAVPEPSSALLVASAVGWVAARRRRHDLTRKPE